MVIAEFTAQTLRGRRIVRNGDFFETDGGGPISAAEILRYDDQGELSWADESLKDWVRRCAEGSEEVPPLVKDLVAAVSGAAEVQNRYWIAVAIVSIFVLIPRVTAADPAAVIGLPFDMPSVQAGVFMFVSVLLLGVLASAFGAALAHLVRTEQFARDMLTVQKDGLVAGRPVSDFYEALRSPSLTRASSIAHAILRVDCIPFSFKSSGYSVERRHWAVGVYVYLKSIVLIVWVVMPGVALIYGAQRYFSIAPFGGVQGIGAGLLVIALCGAALVSLVVAGYLEYRFIRSTVSESWKVPTPKSEGDPGRLAKAEPKPGTETATTA